MPSGTRASSTTREPGAESHVFDLLDAIRRRPNMYLRMERPLLELETLLWGYRFALRNHGLTEQVPSMDRHFCAWLYLRTGWSWQRGWAVAIEEHLRRGQEPLDVFFRFTDEYRKLRPIVRCSVVLGAAQGPTGRLVTVGGAGLIERPSRVDVVQYAPESLFFHRLHYARGPQEQDLLEELRTLPAAKGWVEVEFGIQPSQWETAPRVSKGTRKGGKPRRGNAGRSRS